MSYSEEFHPFEFVRVVYTDAETISKRGITEEVVPAFVALMIRENIERQKTFYYARKVGNVVAMAAANRFYKLYITVLIFNPKN